MWPTEQEYCGIWIGKLFAANMKIEMGPHCLGSGIDTDQEKVFIVPRILKQAF